MKHTIHEPRLDRQLVLSGEVDPPGIRIEIQDSDGTPLNMSNFRHMRSQLSRQEIEGIVDFIDTMIAPPK